MNADSKTTTNRAALSRAGKLRTVLLPFLQAAATETRSQADFEADGVSAYARVFGHEITGRWFRTLYKRVLDRDGGAGDWMRLELYLDENEANRPEPISCDHSDLAHRLPFKDAAKPSAAERQNALEYSFVHFEAMAADDPKARREIKASVIAFLGKAAPGLARSPKALRRTWERQFVRWVKGGRTPQAVKDGRGRNKAGAHLAAIEPDLQLIVAEAWRHDGKLALSIRKLRRDGKLSQAFIDRYTPDVRRQKSYVARSVRREITARLEGMLEYRRSKFAVNMAGPRIARVHDYAPGDYFAADDVTWNIYFWHVGDDGRPAVTRGECLMFFDCRSLYPLGYVLTPVKYNSETVRRGILNIHDKHGLPHRAFIFEKGVWASRLIEGSRPKDFLSWDSYEMGLRERGLRLECRHATTPQGKLIEGVFNIVQQNHRPLPGFPGFNERSYSQEELQKFNGRVRRGLVHPREKFFSIDQWRDVLDRSLETYMHEPQNGELLRGASPAEVFAEHHPLRKLSDNERFLLSTHRVRARVKQNGVAITIRGKRRFYWSRDIGHLMGREVFAWYNIDQAA